ncbi:stage V sporulation protein AA [Virgibacillus sp. NKC19-3]|uniref:stage V sporulation protein AA n=1 Tax=Virgibacillus saliphilus TaxID=2831674 RepID=UPI001C9AA227|nr:stage V sporulation protein AA [Virgibacillus sp. NKC19-3]MBY7143447.1 stage V sporulation protein AA [Virgibacillus sp. NKC19-3]
MAEIVYLRLKKSIELSIMQQVQLKDIAYISTSSSKKRKLENTPIYRITKKDKNIVIIDSFIIIDHLNNVYDDLEFQLIGPTQTIIRINKSKKSPSIVIVSCVWLLLFIGSAMTIMNFHYDVSMQEVQQRLHYLLTGENNEFPLWIQIPYSFGLGIGMLLFFNHWFNKRFNEEPSPLEVEIYNYQQDLDNYVNHYENKLNDTKPPT